jgi:hypothetical protein
MAHLVEVVGIAKITVEVESETVHLAPPPDLMKIGIEPPDGGDGSPTDHEGFGSVDFLLGYDGTGTGDDAEQQ